MVQITQKNIKDLAISTSKVQADAINQSKIRLDNNAFMRGRNNANSADIDIVKINTSDKIEFNSVPQVTADPSAANDLVRKSYVDATLEGLKPKEAVRVASTANVDIATGLENLDTLDGVTLATGDRVLLKDQTTPSQNGIYVVVASGAASRATDFDSLTPIDEINGAYVPVQEGTANAGKFFVQTGLVATLETDAINFAFFNSAATLTGGDGIDITSNVISADLATGGGLKIVTGQIAIEPTDFAGTGLEDDGSDNLRLSTQGNGIAGGAGTTLSVKPDITEVSTTLASAINVDANGVSIKVDDSTIEGSGQGVAGSESLRVKDLGITTAKLAATSVTAAKLGSDVAGSGLTGGNGAAIDLNLAAAGGLEINTDQLQINVDSTNSTTKINGSNEIESLKPKTDKITLAAGDITNQYVDLTFAAHSAGSIMVIPVDGIPQEPDVDFTISLTGGAGGVTRITFAGDIATGGPAALIAGDVLMVKYDYL